MKTAKLKEPLVSDELTKSIEGMDQKQVEQLIRIAMGRYQQLTGRMTVKFVPEAELRQAKKEFNKNLEPITVLDFMELKTRSKKSIADFCSMLGITRQRYAGIAKNPNNSEIIKEIPLSLLIRLYKKLPSLIPSGSPVPINIHEIVGGDHKINLQAFAIVFGRGSASARRWKMGVPPSEASRPMMAAVENACQAGDIFDIMIDNAYEEAKARGLTPFADMGWSELPEHGARIDIDRSFLNAPTVDHRRVEAKEGKIVGWGATEPGIKHIEKRVRRADKKK